MFPDSRPMWCQWYNRNFYSSNWIYKYRVFKIWACQSSRCVAKECLSSLFSNIKSKKWKIKKGSRKMFVPSSWCWPMNMTWAKGELPDGITISVQSLERFIWLVINIKRYASRWEGKKHYILWYGAHFWPQCSQEKFLASSPIESCSDWTFHLLLLNP